MAGQRILESTIASRQKSCNACVRAKRGCDKRYPLCSRCDKKRISCIYTKRTYADAFQSDCDFDPADLDMSWEVFNPPSSLMQLLDGISPSLATSAGADTSRLLAPDAFMEPSLTFVEDNAVSSSDMQLLYDTDGQRGENLDPGPVLSKFDYAQMADICIEYEPWQVYDPNTKAYFIVQSLKGYPNTFAKESHTPWMHRYLYKDQMPSSIQSCFTVSVMYSNVTSSNKTSVIRIICQSLKELKAQQCVETPQEKLARAQALLLYQIICLFDGDLTLRSNADRDMLLLQDWLDELCNIRENISPTNNINNDDIRGHSTTPKSWEWWIFSESVRRTTVMAYAFLGLWNLMCGNNDGVFFGAWKYLHSWTLSRSLWEAPSSFDFFFTWDNKPRHVIENFEFEGYLRTGRGDDADDFSKVLLVAYMGLDKTKQWFKDSGCVF